ncbi:9765_t:CDS:2 [Ambispora gerdemannii]|uniref:9765_t:CDS:1 n=1 Tax=Ambispora gerdemannii TaxID=144530 RepID=A0A9N9BX71_9GLOM|nr:9765_t:CDS:2 [Ambispora gerdemannii]
MTSALKKQQKSISDLSEIVKHLAYDIREVRDGAARSSNVGSGTSKSPQNYTGTIFELWEDIDTLFKEKKTHESGLWQGCIQRNFHKKITKNPKEDTLDSLKLWVSKQKGEIDSEPESEEEGEDNNNDS